MGINAFKIRNHDCTKFSYDGYWNRPDFVSHPLKIELCLVIMIGIKMSRTWCSCIEIMLEMGQSH